jgi:hypothetical protein
VAKKNSDKGKQDQPENSESREIIPISDAPAPTPDVPIKPDSVGFSNPSAERKELPQPPADPGRINKKATEQQMGDHLVARVGRIKWGVKFTTVEIWDFGLDLMDVQNASTRKFTRIVKKRLGMSLTTAYKYVYIATHTERDEVEGLSLESAHKLAKLHDAEDDPIIKRKAKKPATDPRDWIAFPPGSFATDKPATDTATPPATDTATESATADADDAGDTPETPPVDDDVAIVVKITTAVDIIHDLIQSIDRLKSSANIDKTKLHAAIEEFNYIVKHVNDLT